jgi:transposase InsO family protein
VLERAIEHFTALGLKGPEAVMSDNAFAYRKSNAFRAVLAAHGARYILIPPYTPRWNGKVERFIQTLKHEWAYAHSWPSLAKRTWATTSFLRYYNRRRRTADWETGLRSAGPGAGSLIVKVKIFQVVRRRLDKLGYSHLLWLPLAPF